MKRRLLTTITLACGFLFLSVSSAEAQRALRPERTFFIKPVVGISHYYGDANKALDPGFSESFPWLGRMELGYQITTRFSVSGASQLAEYPLIPGDRTQRWTHALMARWTGQGGTARVAPFVQIGLSGTEGGPGDDIGIGPMGGIGLDIAVSNRSSFILELNTNLTSPDRAVDGLDQESPNFDFVSMFGAGLKINFRSAFTPVQVLAVECPAQLAAGTAGTFTATANQDVATPPITYAWNWGDGTTATGMTASKAYTNPGTYTVTFTARNNDHSDTGTCTVTVVDEAPAEIVTLNASVTRFDVCEPRTVNFTTEVRGAEPVTYQWDFGDGTMGTGPSPSHTYTEAGTYTVTLTVSNAHGESSRSLTITADPCLVGICFEITEMNSVFFDRNSSTLTAEGRAALQENLEIFGQCPNLGGRIEGYAAAGERNPQELSADRARAVEQFYVDGGAVAARFMTVGRGILPGVTKKDDALARRVDTIPIQLEEL